MKLFFLKPDSSAEDSSFYLIYSDSYCITEADPELEYFDYPILDPNVSSRLIFLGMQCPGEDG